MERGAAIQSVYHVRRRGHPPAHNGRLAGWVGRQIADPAAQTAPSLNHPDGDRIAVSDPSASSAGGDQAKYQTQRPRHDIR